MTSEYVDQVHNTDMIAQHMGDKEDAGLVSDLLTINSLAYHLPSTLSASVQRQNKVNYADKSNGYTNTDAEMLIRINSSSDFADYKNSYLAFDMIVQAPNLVTGTIPSNSLYLTFGSGGGLACFQRNVIETKNGTQAVYFDRQNFLNTQRLYLENTPSYIASVAQAECIHCMANGNPVSLTTQDGSTAVVRIMGVGPVSPDLTAVPVTGQVIQGSGKTNIADVCLGYWPAAAGSAFVSITRRVVIPLWHLDGFCESQSMVPSYLLSGNRFRLSIQSLPNIFNIVSGDDFGTFSNCTIGVAGGTRVINGNMQGFSFLMSNPSIVVDTYQLSPLIYSKLTEMAARDGLDYVYKSYYYQTSNLNNSGSINVEINKAVSRALTYSTIPTPQVLSPLALDYNQTVTQQVQQYQSHVGNLYFPSPSALAVLNPNGLLDVQRRSSEFYELTMNGVNKMHNGSVYPSAVRMEDFQLGFATLVQSLERGAISFNGISVNNSRSISGLFTFVQANTLYIQSYLAYCNVLKVFLKESQLKL